MKKVNYKQLIRKDIANMESYAPGVSAWDLAKKYNTPIASIIKLNSNENAYGYSPKVKKALTKISYQYYPGSEYAELREKIATYAKVNKSNIFVGSGSDEIIDLLLRLTLENSDAIVDAPPTFSMYAILAKLNKGNIINVPRKNDFSIDTKKIVEKLQNPNTKLFFLANPNNPTGTLTPNQDIEKILQTGKLIIVDEAYFEFSCQTAVPLMKKYPNLIVLRTFSKWAGLAGLRIGYGIMDKYFVNELMKIRTPFNVNVAAEIAAIEILNNQDFAEKSIKKIIADRDKMWKILSQIKNIQVFPSSGNFIFIQTKEKDFEKLKNMFEKNKIVLRYFKSIGNGIRITIGKPQENKKVLQIIKEFYER